MPYANIIQNTAVMNMDRETGPGLSSDDPTRSTPTPDLGITGCNVSFLPAADRDADGCQGDDMSKHAKHSNNSNPTLATINSRCKDSGISTAPSGLLKSHAQVIAPITQIDTTPRTHAPENLEDLYHLHFNLDPHRASLRAYGCDVTNDVTSDVTEKFPDQTDPDSQSLPPQVSTATPDSGISPRREVTYTTHELSRSASPSLPHSDLAMPDASLHNTDTSAVSQDRFSVEEGSEKHVAELTGVAVAAQQGGSCTSVAENESNLKVAVPVQPSSTKFLPDVEELQRRASPTLPANVEKRHWLPPKHLRHHSAPEGRPCQAFTQPAAANIPEYDSCTSQYTCSDFKGFHPLGGPGDGNFESFQHGAQYSSLGLGSVLGDSPSVPGSPHHRMAPTDSPHHRMAPADSPHHHMAPADTVHHRMAPADTVHHRVAPADTVHHRMAPADTVHHHMAPADTLHHAWLQQIPCSIPSLLTKITLDY
ncbi:hypothetical protein EB796_022002 [Bugula neritina]|uniref:Uncharacterized protein n=1 Tax=Bugula neritina TaxID=10212 RepID=A0A7J7J1H8_BUGNE|nr:hypothetical protein EB796_022002 [Bugula neritina]